MNFSELFSLDQTTGVLTWKVRPRHHFPGKRAYLAWNARYALQEAGTIKHDAQGVPYLCVRIGRKQYRANRIIEVILNGPLPADVLVDHIDGNTLNNTPSNLRRATSSQNQHNRKMNANNTSGHKGAYWNASKARFIAEIKLDGKKKHIGTYLTAKEAGLAYAEAASRMHGSFNPGASSRNAHKKKKKS